MNPPRMLRKTRLLALLSLFAMSGLAAQQRDSAALLAAQRAAMQPLAVLVLFAPPYAWTITGVVIAVALAWSGLAAQRARAAGGA